MLLRNRLLIMLIFLLSMTGSIFAQGGDGRSGSIGKSTAVGNRYVRRPRSARRVADATPLVETGRLSIVVNEGGSRIFLSRSETGFETELTTGTSRAPSLIVRTLPVGTYTIIAKKPGYFDENRNVDIHPDKRRKVVVNLRPQMALLTVNTNLADSEIDIADLGKFTGSLKKQFVKPGTYQIAVQRRGYLSQTATVELRSAGREQNISIVLQPLRIDSVLSLAAEKLVNGDLEMASALTNDVLVLNPMHAKANLLFGEIYFERGDLASISFFIKAIRNGETLALPVKLIEGTRLVDVELWISRERIGLRSAARVDLNFSISRSDITGFRRSLDPPFVDHIILNGKSDFHGRPIDPQLFIYSKLAAFKGDPQAVHCNISSRTSVAGRSCATDSDILHKVIKDWLDMKEPADSLR